MIKLDEGALMCDLAETYHIYDYKRLPAQMVAVFSCGLRENSRIKMKMNEQRVSTEVLLLAGINDSLRLLLWTKTKDAQRGKNRPKSIANLLANQKPKEKKEIVFDSGKDFERTRKELLGTMKGGA